MSHIVTAEDVDVDGVSRVVQRYLWQSIEIETFAVGQHAFIQSRSSSHCDANDPNLSLPSN